MNICMFTNTYHPHVGGVARSVRFFAQDLRKLGNRVLIVAPTFPETDEAVDEEENVLRVPAIQNFNGSDFSVRIPIPFFINNEIDGFNPDVVHSHHPFLLGDAAIRVASRRGIPMVFTHHTLYEEYTHYVSADSDMMKQLAMNLSTEYANLCSRVVAPSESIGALISERGVKTPIESIPTGVDVDAFAGGDGEAFRREHTIPREALVLGHLGRLAPEKNLQFLTDGVIKAMQKAPEKFRFLVIGSGPSETQIRENFQSAGLDNQLIMAGKKQGGDLVNGYNAMDVFLFSSKSETQGMVLVEAMAAGLPVIALDASGVREVVEDNRNGRLLPADASSESFAKCLLDFAENGQADAWRREARKTAQKFSRENSAKKMHELYTSLCREEHTQKTAEDTQLEPWEDLIKSLRTEWDLLSQKTSALMNSIQNELNGK